MKSVDVLVIGGGPAGMCAAISAAEMGATVVLAERMPHLGGQLIKQTHMFFGSEKQYASTRGIDIAQILLDKLTNLPAVEIMMNTTVLGVFEDGVATLDCDGVYSKVKPERMIIATGAAEKSLIFPNNDLPGIYGAGAVQTLMNTYGVLPGDKVLMVGAGNIGLIVSYQLMQAGVQVQAIIDAAPNIGGYLVHASKIRRMGVPILTSHTVVRAEGAETLERAVIGELDKHWSLIPGTEKTIEADVMCISVGLSPLSELLFQAGCEMKMVKEFGGFVPVRNELLQTTVPTLFIAGDVGGIEEASSAMVEGHLAGINAALSLGLDSPDAKSQQADLQAQLDSLRAGHAGDKIRSGLSQVVQTAACC